MSYVLPGRRPSIHRRETGQGYLVPIARTGRYIDLPVVCSIHARSMSVREEVCLSMVPPSSSRFLQQQLPFNNSIKMDTN
ncbi:unnamed protein product, partial [Rotaria magnacalcarata]